MKSKRRMMPPLLSLVLLAACNLPIARPAPVQPTTIPLPRPSLTPIAAASPSPNVPSPPSSDEAILILEPGPGSRVISPLHVAGIADPTFEQTLVVRIVRIDGTELALQPVTIAADLGSRGPFAGEVHFTTAGEESAFIQVYTESARDGGVIHLNSVGVMLTVTGPARVEPKSPHPEQILIHSPEMGAVVQGGSVTVEGFGLAGFEGTLVIEIQDAEGNVVGSQPIIVEAPDIGLPGPFSAEVIYLVGEAGPGRVVVRDISPAFGGDSHLSSVEISLEP